MLFPEVSKKSLLVFVTLYVAHLWDPGWIGPVYLCLNCRLGVRLWGRGSVLGSCVRILCLRGGDLSEGAAGGLPPHPLRPHPQGSPLWGFVNEET